MSRFTQEQLDRLMRTATRRQEALVSHTAPSYQCAVNLMCQPTKQPTGVSLQPRRIASVRNLHGLLRTPQGQTAGQAMLPALWPAALQLLQDSQVDMRQIIAPVVGFLGALAARPGRPAGMLP